MCLFMGALGLGCCARAFSSCSEQGLLFVAVASLAAGAWAPAIEAFGLSSCGGLGSAAPRHTDSSLEYVKLHTCHQTLQK